MSLPVRVYTPDSRSLRPKDVVREIADGFRHSSGLAYRLFTRDVRTEYSVAAFGFIWDIIDPLVLAGIFCLLYQSRVVGSQEIPMHFSLYVVFGMLLYQCFIESVTLAMDSLKRARTLITQVRVPPEALPLAAFYRACFNSSFRLVVMIGFALAAREISLPGVVQAVLLLPIMIVSGVLIGTLIAPFNAIYSDFGRFMRVLFMALRFVTPTVFFFAPGSMMDTINYFNPIALFVRNIRSLAVLGEWYAPELLILHTGIIALLGAAGLFIYHISMPVVAERL